MKKNQKGFGIVEGLIIALVLGVISLLGWSVWHKNNDAVTDSVGTTETLAEAPAETSNELPDSQSESKEYRFANDGLTLSYNPSKTIIETREPTISNDLYIENLIAKTGVVTLAIKAGIDGIGGGPGCAPEARNRTFCEVIATRNGVFLGESITYRLVKVDQPRSCGYSGVLSCEEVPLTTSYLLDTYSGTDYFGPCCATINAEARNIAKMAAFTGSLLVDISADKSVMNEDLFSNKDFLETIKIIESMHY